MEIHLYQTLIADFLANRVSVSEFQKKFLEEFKTESDGMEQSVFKILDEFFADVDCYSPDCKPGKENDFEISEKRLSDQATITLKKLSSAQGK